MTSSVCCHSRDMAQRALTVWSIHKVSSRANSHKMLERALSLSASFVPKQNETLQRTRQHGEWLELNQKGTHWKPNRKPTSVLWVKQRDIGYRHFSLVFSLWQGLRYLSGVCLCHFWCQSKQTSEAAIRTGQSRGINTSIHPSPHMHIKTLKNMQVHTHTWAYTQRSRQLYTVGTLTPSLAADF